MLRYASDDDTQQPKSQKIKILAKNDTHVCLLSVPKRMTQFETLARTCTCANARKHATTFIPSSQIARKYISTTPETTPSQEKTAELKERSVEDN